MAVTGTPSDEWGEVVTAWVVADGAAPSLEDLRAYCAGRLAPYKQPAAGPPGRRAAPQRPGQGGPRPARVTGAQVRGVTAGADGTAALPPGAGPPGPPGRPHARLERSLLRDGAGPVAGMDEVGRGAWAGPASVGVVVYCPERRAPRGVRDSKLLTEERREELLPLVTSWCLDWAVGHAEPGECDRLGMTAALRLAARRALGASPWSPRSSSSTGTTTA